MTLSETVWTSLPQRARDTLEELENTRRWAWGARQDAAHERQVYAAHNVLLATSADYPGTSACEELTRQIMALCFNRV